MSLRKSAIIEKAQKFASKGQFKQAIQEWGKLITTLPNDGNTYNAIGDLHLKDGDQKRATDFFIQAAEAFQLAGFELKSIAVFKKALKVDPSRTEISEKLAGVYADRGLIGNAIASYLQAAKSYLSQGSFEASLSVYRKISDLDPENANILLEIAEMCQKEGHNENAIEEYKKLVSFFEKNNQTSEAEAIIQKIVALDPSYSAQNQTLDEAPEVSEPPINLPTPEALPEDDPDILNTEADSNFPETEAFDKAQTEHTASEFFEPESELMTDEQTIYAAEDSLQIDHTQGEDKESKSLEAQFTEADVYMQYELVDKAIAQLEMAAVQFPTEDSALLKLKEIYEQQGNKTKQIETLQILADLYQTSGEENKCQSALETLKTLQGSAQTPSSPKTLPHDNTSEKDLFEKDKVSTGIEEIDTADPDNEPSSHFKPAAQIDDLLSGEQLFQESEISPNINEKEITQPVEPPPLNYLPTDESLSDLDLPELEQDPVPSSPEPENSSEPAFDDPFLEATDFDSKTPSETYTEGDTNEIDFDEPTLNAIIPPDVETKEMSSEALEIYNKQPKAPLIKKENEEKSAEEGQEDYIDLQAFFADELELGDEEEDETSLERTVRTVQDKHQGDRQPEAIETEYDLGIAYREMGMLAEAVKAFENASQGDSRFKDALTMLATCHRERGSIEDAIASLEQGLIRNISDQSVTIALKYELALLYDEQGDHKKAAYLYDAVFDVDPEHREVAKKRAQTSRAAFTEPPQNSPESFVISEEKPEKKKDRVSYL